MFEDTQDINRVPSQSPVHVADEEPLQVTVIGFQFKHEHGAQLTPAIKSNPMAIAVTGTMFLTLDILSGKSQDNSPKATESRPTHI